MTKIIIIQGGILVQGSEKLGYFSKKPRFPSLRNSDGAAGENFQNYEFKYVFGIF